MIFQFKALILRKQVSYIEASAPSTPTLDSLLADVDVQCLPLDDEVAEEVVDIDDLSVSRLSQS